MFWKLSPQSRSRPYDPLPHSPTNILSSSCLTPTIPLDDCSPDVSVYSLSLSPLQLSCVIMFTHTILCSTAITFLFSSICTHLVFLKAKSRPFLCTKSFLSIANGAVFPYPNAGSAVTMLFSRLPSLSILTYTYFPCETLTSLKIKFKSTSYLFHLE